MASNVVRLCQGCDFELFIFRCKGVIIVPRWEGQGFWVLLMSDYMCTFIKRVIDFPGYKYVVPGTSGNSVFNNFNGILEKFIFSLKPFQF